MRCAWIARPAGGGLMQIAYLQASGEMPELPGFAEKQEFAALSSGMERMCEGGIEETSDSLTRDRLKQSQTQWAAIADAQWPRVCLEFAGSLPAIQAYVVVPSSRENRQAPLRDAIRRRFPAALEIVYQRMDGVRFAGTGERAIFKSLVLTARPPESPTGIAIIDDYVGTGRTLRALAHRLRVDFPGVALDAAAPGITATVFRDSGQEPDSISADATE